MKRLAIVSLSFLSLLPALAQAQEPAADAPRVVLLVPTPLPTYPASRADCSRWDSARRNWRAVGIVTGTLSTTGGLLSALGSIGTDKTARVSVAITSAVLAAVGALAVYESGEYASLHQEQCTSSG